MFKMFNAEEQKELKEIQDKLSKHLNRDVRNELVTKTLLEFIRLVEGTKMKGFEGSFWEVCAKSKEEDVLVCLDYPMQNIVNNGDYTFMWEESWEHVELSGEFLGMKWKIREEE